MPSALLCFDRSCPHCRQALEKVEIGWFNAVMAATLDSPGLEYGCAHRDCDERFSDRESWEEHLQVCPHKRFCCHDEGHLHGERVGGCGETFEDIEEHRASCPVRVQCGTCDEWLHPARQHAGPFECVAALKVVVVQAKARADEMEGAARRREEELALLNDQLRGQQQALATERARAPQLERDLAIEMERAAQLERDLAIERARVAELEAQIEADAAEGSKKKKPRTSGNGAVMLGCPIF